MITSGSRTWRDRGVELRAWIGWPWDSRATLTYFLILVANRIVIFSLSGFTNGRGQTLGLDTLVLRAVSTNLSRLRRDPFDVLISSAFFVRSIWEVVLFGIAAVLVLAPLERRIGTGRWITGFVAGHVGATLIVAGGLALAINTHHLVSSTARTIDVGMSYGTCALLGIAASCLTLPSRQGRRLVASALLFATVVGLAVARSYTAWGHLTATIIGLGIGSLFTMHSFANAPPEPRIASSQ